jgi:alginate O-acetyltransferase complex protein AlgI
MRDYLYFPGGGNRVHPSRLYVNLWTVFLLSGFWHGAAWTFIAWGAYHGFFLILDRLFLLRVYRRLGALSVLPTFLLTMVGWVLFRAETLPGALTYLGRLVGHQPGTRPVGGHAAQPLAALSAGPFNQWFWLMLALGSIFAFMNVVPGLERRTLRLYAAHPLSPGRAVALGGTAFLLISASAGAIISSTFNPFIYFRF